jgi:glycosyltransferase involved in cell wall biosynthesis
MTILHLINSLALGGAERLVAGLAPLQAKAGHDVVVACLSGRDDFFGHALEAAGVRVVRLSGGPVYDPLHLVRVRRLLESERPDVLHVHLFPAQYLAAAASFGKARPAAMVTTEHSTDNRRAGRVLFRGVERLTYGRFDALAAVSGTVASLFSAWLGPAVRIVVVPNGVDLGDFHPLPARSPESVMALRRRLGLPEHGFLACMAGRLEAPKDPGLFVRALAALPANMYGVISGEGSLRDSCEVEAVSLGLAERVLFLGRRNDLPDVFRACDAFVHPSAYEGFGLAAVEAMACGLPCLLSDLPALKEAGGDDALYFAPGDAPALAAGLRQLAGDQKLSDRLSSRGRDRAGLFDLGTCADRYLSLYSEIFERNATCPKSPS